MNFKIGFPIVIIICVFLFFSCDFNGINNKNNENNEKENF